MAAHRFVWGIVAMFIGTIGGIFGLIYLFTIYPWTFVPFAIFVAAFAVWSLYQEA